MKLYFKACLTALVFIGECACCFSQNSFRNYLSDAYDSSLHGNYVSALALLNEAKNLKGRDTGYNESVNLYLGTAYEAMQKIDSAVFYYGEAIRYFEDKKDYPSLISVYDRLGAIEINFTKRYGKAVEYYNRQAFYLSLHRDSAILFDCYDNTGIAYQHLALYDSALYYFTLVLSDPSPQNTARQTALLLIADTYSLQQRYSEALYYYNKAIAAFRQVNDSAQVYISLVNKGDCLMHQSRFGESLQCFLEAEQWMSHDAMDSRKELYHNLSFVYGKTDDYKKAFYYKDKEGAIKDSINTQSIVQAATEMEAKYEVRKKQDSLKISQQNLVLAGSRLRERQRDFIITLISAIAIALLAFLGFRNARNRRIANEKLSIEKAKVETLAGELSEANQTKTTLFSIISHDLRSPISSLYSLLKMNEIKAVSSDDAGEVSGQVTHLLDVMEDLLVWSKSQMEKFTLQKVTVFVDDVYEELIALYLDTAKLKQVSVLNKITQPVKIKTDENLLKTILRNLVSNSIDNAPPGTDVWLNAMNKEDGIVCSVSNESSEDNFIRFKDKLHHAYVGSGLHGLGLVLTKEFSNRIGANITISYSDGMIDCRLFIPYLSA